MNKKFYFLVNVGRARLPGGRYSRLIPAASGINLIERSFWRHLASVVLNFFSRSCQMDTIEILEENISWALNKYHSNAGCFVNVTGILIQGKKTVIRAHWTSKSAMKYTLNALESIHALFRNFHMQNVCMSNMARDHPWHPIICNEAWCWQRRKKN